MPRDGSGVYSTPPGTHGTPNTTILSANYNSNVDDVATDLNTPRPIVAGGTGATTAAGALTALGAVAKAGDTMTGLLVLSADPSAALGAATKQYADTKVAKTGDTMTGELILAPSAGSWPTLEFNKAASGLSNQILGYTNNSPRWTVNLGSNVPETGGNVGSDLDISRFSDGGVLLSTPLVIQRSSGRVIVGHGPTNTDAMVLHVNFDSSGGDGGIGFRGIDGWYACIFSNAAGTIVGGIVTSATATAYNTTSDDRLKEDLQSFDAGNIVDDTEVYDFKWKSTGERAYGVIAQQAIEVYPAAVTHTEKNDWWGIDYSKYVPVLLQELKVLRARVAALEGGGLSGKPA